eukprot:351012-Chlamydomonas_euryale.AAC.4
MQGGDAVAGPLPLRDAQLTGTAGKPSQTHAPGDDSALAPAATGPSAAASPMVDDNAHAEASPAAAVAPDPDAAPAVERSSAAAAADGGDGAADGGGDLDAGAGTGVACEAAAESMADKSVANTCMANTGAAGPADTDAKAAMTGSAAVAAVAELPPDVRTTVEAAEALLETSGDAEAWVSLTDADLAATVGRYRDAVKALEAKLMPGSGVGGGGAAQPMTATAGSGHGASTAAASRSGTVAAAGGGDGAACASGGAGHALGAAAAAGPHTGCEVGSVDDLDPSEWQVPPQCIPIHANVTTYKWAQLYEHTTFDVIMMDPPWQLATANPTRGVSLGYSQLTDADIANLPVPQLQRNGFLFIWVINAKYKWTLDLFDRWGYTWVAPVRVRSIHCCRDWGVWVWRDKLPERATSSLRKKPRS